MIHDNDASPLTIAERPPLRLLVLLVLSVIFASIGIYAQMAHLPGLWPLLDIVLFAPAAVLFWWQIRGPNLLVIEKTGFTHRNSWNGAYRIGFDEAGPFTVEGNRIVFDYRDPETGETERTFLTGRFAKPLGAIAARLNEARAAAG